MIDYSASLPDQVVASLYPAAEQLADHNCLSGRVVFRQVLWAVTPH